MKRWSWLSSGWTLGLTTAVLLLATVSPTWAAEKKWYRLTGTIGYEHDDNVNQGALDRVSGKSDQAAVFTLQGRVDPLPSPDWQLEFGYNYYQQIHKRESQFDLVTHTPQVTFGRIADTWEAKVRYSYEYNLLERDSFLRTHNFIPIFGFAIAPPLWTEIRYRFQRKTFFTDTRRDADNHSGQVEQYLYFWGNRGYLGAMVRLERNLAESDFFTYTGLLLSPTIQVPIPLVGARFNVAYDYLHRIYGGTFPDIDRPRRDNVRTTTVTLTKTPLGPLYAEFVYTRISSGSNLGSADYRENIYSANVGAKF
ncbi:MAG: hypothetical protein HYY85_12305 [Deltaproteobacteria bacterium]|nr:hypothetical protein [Deltaproteobacteria bacterium]